MMSEPIVFISHDTIKQGMLSGFEVASREMCRSSSRTSREPQVAFVPCASRRAWARTGRTRRHR
jgi:hypothetical protein